MFPGNDFLSILRCLILRCKSKRLLYSTSTSAQDIVFADMKSLKAPANNNWNQIGPEDPAYSAGSDA
jgi:hypothetical protein